MVSFVIVAKGIEITGVVRAFLHTASDSVRDILRCCTHCASIKINRSVVIISTPIPRAALLRTFATAARTTSRECNFAAAERAVAPKSRFPSGVVTPPTRSASNVRRSEGKGGGRTGRRLSKIII
jgi:hypothetical protein